jgi:hypothetical protein
LGHRVQASELALGVENPLFGLGKAKRYLVELFLEVSRQYQVNVVAMDGTIYGKDGVYWRK